MKLDPPSDLQSNVSLDSCVLTWGVSPALEPLASLLSYELAFKRQEEAWEVTLGWPAGPRSLLVPRRERPTRREVTGAKRMCVQACTCLYVCVRVCLCMPEHDICECSQGMPTCMRAARVVSVFMCVYVRASRQGGERRCVPVVCACVRV